MANVERNTAIPLYLQIAEDIKSKIKKEELKANSRIPTELELSDFYQVSRITIRKALELLVDEEILIRKQKIGTFVSNKKISRTVNSFMGFTKSCEVNGDKASSEFLSAELVKALPSDVKNLNLNEDDKIIRIRRVRFCNDVPVILEEAHYPRSYAYLLAEDLRGSLHEILTAHGVVLHHGQKTIGVCYATQEEAKHLDVKENEAMILSKDITYDINGVPVYYSKEVINAERYEFKVMTSVGEG